MSRKSQRYAGTRRAAGTTIASVNSNHTFTDSGNGLAGFKTGDIVCVSGDPSNDGYYYVNAGGVAGTLDVTPGVPDKSAGVSVEIRVV